MRRSAPKATVPTRSHVLVGALIRERLGDDGASEGLLAGRSLRELVERHPDELVGRRWRGPRFPVLTKFIDGTGMLPVHLHADDETARRLKGQPDGKTEAWHVPDAGAGATALLGPKAGCR